MDKGRGYQDAGAKVTREEEELVGDGDFGESLDDDGECASFGGQL